jgi:hypothetical protein
VKLFALTRRPAILSDQRARASADGSVFAQDPDGISVQIVRKTA